jgi:hypothetical protein
MFPNSKVYCTQHELLLILWQAFVQGHGSPFELRDQEIDRLEQELIERSTKRTKAETLKRYSLDVEDDIW